MKAILRIIFLFYFSIIYIFCQENIDELFISTFKNMQKLPIGSTIYYSRNIKCTSFNSTSSFCLINNNLYINTNGDIKTLLLNISGYSDTYYYELNIYNETDENHRGCIITHFLNNVELIFKYYSINIINNTYNNTDFNYYNVSMDPINKGINCHTKDIEFKFICFYINKDKNIIEMNINTINRTNMVYSLSKIVKTEENINFIDNNTFIMSSLFKNKLKFFSCLICDMNYSFSIYVNKNRNLDFNEIRFSSNIIKNDDFKRFDFICNKDQNMILFTVFNYQNFPISNSMNVVNLIQFNVFIFQQIKLNKLRELQIIELPPIPIEEEEEFIFDINIKNKSDCEPLIFEEKENILFFKPKKQIINFQFNERNDETDTECKTGTDFEEIEKENPEKIKLLNVSISKEEILENINNIMKEIMIGETYEHHNDNFSILIYPSSSKLLANKTHLDFEECGSTLRTHYNLSNKSELTFFQMEISNNNKHSLINQVEYQVYDEQKNQLELSICNDSNIKIFYGIKKNSNLDISMVNSFKDSEVDILDINDKFFNDVCYPYSEDGNDLILEDRIKEIYQNFTLCEKGCTFNDIDILNMLISCTCNIKENMTTIIKEIKEEAIGKITSLNFEIIRCYNLVLSMKGKMKNYGFWILSLFFLFYILFLIKYSCNGITPIKEYIFNEMAKFGYINKGAYKKNKILSK